MTMNKKLIFSTVLFFSIMFFLPSIEATTATETIIANNASYAKGYTYKHTTSCTQPDVLIGEYSSAQYTAISASDNSYVSIGSSSGYDYASHIYTFQVPLPYTTVNWINETFEALDDGGYRDKWALYYIWNFTANGWQQFTTVNYYYDGEYTTIYNFTSGFADYINSTRHMKFKHCIYNKYGDNDQWKADFARIILSYIYDDVKPTYSLNSTNTTIANQSTLFGLNWTDNIGLSGFIFSWFNGANWTWTNNTADLESGTIQFKGATTYTCTNNGACTGLASSACTACNGAGCSYLFSLFSCSGTLTCSNYGTQATCIACSRCLWSYSSGDTEANKTATTYTSVLAGFLPRIVNITVTANVSVYNKTRSNGVNSNPDLWLEAYDGSNWIEVGNMSVTTTGNFSKSTTSSSVLNGWTNPTNRQIRIKGRYIDANATAWDEINYTAVWVQVDINGQFYNDTWTSFNSGTWSNVTKLVNSTVGSTIQWLVYANDTSTSTVGGNWNASEIYSYVTTSSAYISILLSSNFAGGVMFNSRNPATNDNPAVNNSQGYNVSVSADTIGNVDICVKVNAPLTKTGDGTIGNGNYTWNSSIAVIPTVTGSYAIQTTYDNTNKVGTNKPANSVVIMGFWLDVPSAQSSGNYNNTIFVQGVQTGETCT